MRVGTSGFSYPEWKGSFYPEKLPQKDMLPYYAERLETVELNNTFYRIPKKDDLSRWAGQVPAGFMFAVKAPQKITHHTRLRPEAAEPTTIFIDALKGLGDALGPVLFQLPPNMKRDDDRLSAYLELLPQTLRVTFEFRHASWFCKEVYDLLAARGVALCWADAGDELPCPDAATTSWGYLRLRRVDYDKQDLARWAAKIRAQAWSETYVLFKHEDGATGPVLAQELNELF